MINFKNSYKYINIGTLHSDEDINVSIAFLGENTLQNQFIINRFPYNKENIELFKKFFNYYSSKSKPKDFHNFFTFEKSFYTVFKYVKCESIKTRFDKKLCTHVFTDRSIILENILMEIDKISDLPIEALVCATKPENVCVDDEKNVHFIYNFGDIFKNKDVGEKELYQNIHDIIYIMLQQEANAAYNKQLHIVLNKCKNGVYSSIPQLTVELKKAEQICQNSSWISYLKYQFSLRKPQITKLSKVGTYLLIALVAVYLVKQQLTKNTNPSVTTPAVSIGEINYSADGKDESDKNVTETATNVIKSENKPDLTLTKGLDLEYEDYIVQYGDTVSSIADSYYRDSAYIKAIATFNGISESEKLEAGELIKLPNKTAIALYLSN